MMISEVVRYLAVRGLNNGQKVPGARNVRSVASAAPELLERADTLIRQKYWDNPILLEITSAYAALTQGEKIHMDWNEASRAFVRGDGQRSLTLMQGFRDVARPKESASLQVIPENPPELSEMVRSLLVRDEDERLEFKSSLRWDLKRGEESRAISEQIVKTIGAFLNTRGGILLVGVSDDKTLVGLDADRFETDDACCRFFANLVKERIGLEFVPSIRSYLVTIEGLRVLTVDCTPADEPVFVGDDKFFVRNGNTTASLTPRQAASYVLRRFGSSRVAA